MSNRIIRVFPRRTSATPDDDLARVGFPGMLDQADEVHVSVTFSWDIPLAEKLATAWSVIAPVKIGGPATGQRGEDFIPGMYLKRGYVITSRGCHNKCWFCTVPIRDGDIRELPINEGNNVLDDNLLACSDQHIKSVFAMLKEQRNVQFTGWLEAAMLKNWQVKALKELHPKQLFFAYDTTNDLEPLREAGHMLQLEGFNFASHVLRAYVLVGFPGDSFDKAENRLWQTVDAGFLPMAMLYRDTEGKRDINWMRFQKTWARPVLMARKIKQRINLCELQP